MGWSYLSLEEGKAKPFYCLVSSNFEASRLTVPALFVLGLASYRKGALDRPFGNANHTARRWETNRVIAVWVCATCSGGGFAASVLCGICSRTGSCCQGGQSNLAGYSIDYQRQCPLWPGLGYVVLLLMAGIAQGFKLVQKVMFLAMMGVGGVVNLKMVADTACQASVFVATQDSDADALPILREQKRSVRHSSQCLWISPVQRLAVLAEVRHIAVLAASVSALPLEGTSLLLRKIQGLGLDCLPGLPLLYPPQAIVETLGNRLVKDWVVWKLPRLDRLNRVIPIRLLGGLFLFRHGSNSATPPNYVSSPKFSQQSRLHKRRPC
jgi:hypothetical protein